MRLSNRLWYAIAWRFHERLDCPPCMTVWAKVKINAKGKRHAMIEIPINAEERVAIAHMFEHCTDEYWQAITKIERENHQ